jgi:lipid A oxidase
MKRYMPKAKKTSSLIIFFISVLFSPNVLADSTKERQYELSIYTGYNWVPHASIDFKGAEGYGVANGSYSTGGWSTKPFSSPVYWGIRGTYWPSASSRWGYSLDLNHSKIYAKQMPAGLKHLEFSDGMNTLVFNLMHRYLARHSLWGSEPYWGLGLGISYPHVEVISQADPEVKTFDYQYTGIVGQAMAGLRFPLGNNWQLFTEYRFQYIPMKADLDTGGSIEAKFLNHHLNLGVNYLF